jgi:hypothetical protein
VNTYPEVNSPGVERRIHGLCSRLSSCLRHIVLISSRSSGDVVCSEKVEKNSRVEMERKQSSYSVVVSWGLSEFGLTTHTTQLNVESRGG